jgi:hypothetical protein
MQLACRFIYLRHSNFFYASAPKVRRLETEYTHERTR